MDNYYVYVSGPWGAQIGARLEDQDRVDELLQIMRTEIVADLLDTQNFVQQGNPIGNFDGGRQVVLHLLPHLFWAKLLSALRFRENTWALATK